VVTLGLEDEAVGGGVRRWRMDEAEWLASNVPMPMLAFLEGKASDRKLRLFAVACVRGTFWWQLSDPTRKNPVEVAEYVADGQGTKDELGSAHFAAWLADGGITLAGCAAREAASPLAWDAGTDVPCHMREAVRRGELDTESVTYSVHVLRCIFGNPFHPVSLAPACRTAAVISLATAAYEERELPSGHLDNDRLAILADALEDAGEIRQDVLGHLRGPGPHVRGCWVIDALLGKQ
jgi:hypothetical protein